MGMYPFLYHQHQYLVTTVPGSARAGLFCPEQERYLGYFEPFQGPQKQGYWLHVENEADWELLEQLSTYVSKICEYRRVTVFGGGHMPYFWEKGGEVKNKP